MDCSVMPLQRFQNEYFLVQTVDFFYPLVDDPRIMGKIALANVLSDVYAVGVTDIDKLIMLISAPTELSESQRDIVVPMIIEGFNDSAKKAGCHVEVQNMIINPWCIVGGIASSICKQNEIIFPSNAQHGDLLVITKPLGTHLATNSFIWMQEGNENYQKLMKSFTDADIVETFNMAIASMTYLNKNAAILMHKYNAHAATDITGFGLLGHAKNLVDFQKEKLTFKINKLPIMKNVLEFGKLTGQDGKLKAGKAVETSGGLLICLSAENAIKFCDEFKALTNGKQNAWIVGEVIESSERNAILDDNVEYLEARLETCS